MLTKEERRRELDEMEIGELKKRFYKYASLPDGISSVSPSRMKETIIAFEFPDVEQTDEVG